MNLLKTILKSFFIAIWFMFLTFPFMAITIDSLNKKVSLRWTSIGYVGIATFFLSFLWRDFMKIKDSDKGRNTSNYFRGSFVNLNHFKQKRILIPSLTAAFLLMALFPLLVSSYQTNIMTNALLYVMLGLGLNIVVGLAGLLDLGYVAFYAVGAYLYALLNHHFGISFWLALPLGAALASIFGILLGIPVLRLKGDYLAIVTLGFGEIIRLILENWDKVFYGPSGISHISRPSFFGIETMETSVHHAFVFMYYVVVLLVLLTVFFVRRLKNSRIGRALLALKEDEIACQAMGIDKMRTKLTAFALGATWAGMAGVIFAAKTTFINPASFTFMESAIILSIVVIGGMGSVPGVIIGAFFLVLLPEYFRELGDYRMLVFGASMIVIMVFKPQGLIENTRTVYTIPQEDLKPGES